MASTAGFGGVSRDSGDATQLARLLFADLAAELDGALNTNALNANGLETSTHAANGDAANSTAQSATPIATQVDRLLDSAATAVRDGELGRAAFEGISGPESKRLELAFIAARSVAALAGLTVPEPEAFWAAGVDRAALARALVADRDLLPVPTPHGLGAERWMLLYRAAARQPASPLSLASPLALAQDVETAFAELDVPPKTSSVVTGFGGGQLTWTLRLIAATATPPRTDVSHLFGPHPTLSEMLMLQLMRFTLGEGAVDRHSFTWLAGTFAGGRFAARHFFDTAAGSVGVNSREIGNQGPHLGVRPPVGN